MNKIFVPISIVLLLLATASGYYFMNKAVPQKDTEMSPATQNEPTSSVNIPLPTDSSEVSSDEATPSLEQSVQLTESDVAEHSDEKSCWTIIDGKVYDVTSFISKHKGGPQKILSICGKDGSSAFGNQHGESQMPQQVLSTFLKGTLVEMQ